MVAPIPSQARAPWYIWLCVLAITSAIVGAYWDISWHRSIGRDTFWTPAHIAIYLCGVLAGVVCSYLILSTTFDETSPLRDSSVRMWGFRAPLGAFIAAWGGIAMLVSAPFDNWWHAAYGLDVKIISPPHALLFIGDAAIEIGAIILILGQMNRAGGVLRRTLNGLFLYAGAMLVLLLAIFILSYSFPQQMHTAMFYRAVCTALPFALVGIGQASQQRWGSTKVAAIYMVFCMAAIWILPGVLQGHALHSSAISDFADRTRVLPGLVAGEAGRPQRLVASGSRRVYVPAFASRRAMAVFDLLAVAGGA
jgi:hypothetical protein